MSAGATETGLVVLADTGEPRASERVWGTGGWLPPTQRVALDWLTLARLLGWRARVAPIEPASVEREPGRSPRRVVLASESHATDRVLIETLARQLRREPLLLIAPAAAPGSPLASLAGTARGSGAVTGQDLRWIGPGAPQRWTCRRSIEAARLEMAPGAEVWATLDGTPIVTTRAVGRGRLASLAFDPSAARDTAGAATALLSHLLVRGWPTPTAWLDFDGALVLRMDDPGGAQNVHSRRCCYDKLDETAWSAIGAELARRRGRLSIGYVSAWVDDGDSRRGELTLDGEAVARRAGALHPSPRVRYRDLAGNSPGAVSDYASEYRGIRDLVSRGLASVELHGHTHMHPDSSSWARAADRYDAVHWYRELGATASAALAALPTRDHPIALAREAIRLWFGEPPSTLICPGDEWTDAALAIALDLDLELVSSYYLAMRIENRFCWAQHVCAPYLDRPDPTWFDAPLPVIGYFHDREPALEGVSWLARWLDAWGTVGATRLMDLRQLADALTTPLHLECDPWRLEVGIGAPERSSSLQVRLWTGVLPLPTEVTLLERDRELRLTVEACDDGSGRVRLPPSRPAAAEAGSDER